MGVIIGLLLIKPVESLFGSILVLVKGYLEVNIFVLALGGAYRTPPGISVG